jgi:hypothetical protein
MKCLTVLHLTVELNWVLSLGSQAPCSGCGGRRPEAATRLDFGAESSELGPNICRERHFICDLHRPTCEILQEGFRALLICSDLPQYNSAIVPQKPLTGSAPRPFDEDMIAAGSFGRDSGLQLYQFAWIFLDYVRMQYLGVTESSRYLPNQYSGSPLPRGACAPLNSRPPCASGIRS